MAQRKTRIAPRDGKRAFWRGFETMKKKIKDMTLKEIISFCNSQHSCEKCPMRQSWHDDCELSNFILRKPIKKEIEIEVPEHD